MHREVHQAAMCLVKRPCHTPHPSLSNPNMNTLDFSALAKFAAAAALVCCSAANAAVVTLSSNAADSQAGTHSLEIQVADVAQGKAIGSYDITLRYDASVWAPTVVSFGQYLSGPDPQGSITSYDTSVPGIIQLLEISLITMLDPQSLDILQPASFALGKIDFSAVGMGVGAFSIQNASLFDELGEPIGANAVPEPGAMALALIGLGVLGAHRRRARRVGPCSP